MRFQNPEQILIHCPANNIINLGLGVHHFAVMPGTCHKAVIKPVAFGLAGRLDLDAVEYAVTLGHQVVTGKILHRGQHAIPVAEQRTGHAGNTNGTYLSGG